jgi:hypothetical protein
MAIISIPTSISGISIPGPTGQVLSGPLAALFGDSKAISTISYPQELATDATKSHYVQFSIKEIIPQSYEKTVQAIQGVYQKATDVTTEQAKMIAENAASNAANVLKNLKENPMDTVQVGIGKLGNAIGSTAEMAENTIRSLVTPKYTQSKAVISLYMPDTLEANYTANYNEISLAAELGTIQSIRQIAQVASTFGEGYKSSGTSGAFGAASSDPNVIAGAVGFGLGILDKIPGVSTGGNLADVLLQGQGYASNPQMQMIYRGTSFRTFSLAFTFTPKSQAEAKIVNNILYQFKYYAAPALTAGKSTSSESMFLIPPALFNVKFFMRGVDNKYLPKYADCVLKNIDVNYAPNGFAAHIDGAPVQTHLTLQFEEIEIVDKARLSKGYNNLSEKDGLR